MDIFSLINEISNWVGWPLIALLLLISGGYIFWILNQRIEGLKENNHWLEAKVTEAENFSPSALIERLAARHKILTEELENLYDDYQLEKQNIENLEREKMEITEEFNRALVKIHSITYAEGRVLSTFFEKWYSREGGLSVFCNDLVWLEDEKYHNVIEALRRKGKELKLYLRVTEHPLVELLAENGAHVFHVKHDIQSSHRFSILEKDNLKSIIIRDKNVEKEEILFEEYTNQRVLVNLALDMLNNCYDHKMLPSSKNN